MNKECPNPEAEWLRAADQLVLQAPGYTNAYVYGRVWKEEGTKLWGWTANPMTNCRWGSANIPEGLATSEHGAVAIVETVLYYTDTIPKWPKPYADAVQPSPAGPAARCVNCNQPVDAGAYYCSTCKAQLTTEPEVKRQRNPWALLEIEGDDNDQ